MFHFHSVVITQCVKPYMRSFYIMPCMPVWIWVSSMLLNWPFTMICQMNYVTQLKTWYLTNILKQVKGLLTWHQSMLVMAQVLPGKKILPGVNGQSVSVLSMLWLKA